MAMFFDYSLENIIPHRGKMKLLSRIISCDLQERSILSEVDISKNSLFYDYSLNGVPAYIGFEYMAQAISALSGINNLENGRKIEFGFILSVNNFNAKCESFKVGSVISIYAKETVSIDNLFSFNCKIMLGETELAAADINTIKIGEEYISKVESYGK